MHTGYLHDYLMRDMELIKTDYTSNELSALDSSYQYSGYGRDALTIIILLILLTIKLTITIKSKTKQ